MVNRLIMLLVAVFISACSTTVPQKETVTVTQYKYVTIDDSLLTDCIPNKPIDKDSYLALSVDARESELTKYIIHLLSVNKQCNIQLSNIKTLNNKLKEQNKEGNNDSKQTDQ